MKNIQMNDDPYKILGVSKDASDDDINAAYKKAARWAHPDGGGSAEEFDEIKRASQVLLDPEKRRRFDEDGIFDENKPDNITSTALQRITMFFVQSIQATLNAPQGLHLHQLDLIQGANTFFDIEIQNCHKRIDETGAQINQFEKVFKRLKTKRNKDVIRNMLNHHVSVLKGNIMVQDNEIKILNEAKLILKDYTFEQEQTNYIRGLYR